MGTLLLLLLLVTVHCAEKALAVEITAPSPVHHENDGGDGNGNGDNSVSRSKSVLVVPHPCLALSHIMTFMKIGQVANKERDYHFTYLLSQADELGLQEIGLATELMETTSSIISYPGAFNRSECLDIAAQYSDLSPMEVAMLFVRVGTKSCESLLSHELLRTNSMQVQFDLFFGDLGWPCSTLVADRLDLLRQQMDAGTTTVGTKPRMPRIVFQGNIAIDPWCEYYGVPSPATEIPQVMGTARWFLGEQGHYPIGFAKRFVNVFLREVSRQVVRTVMLRPYSALRKEADIPPYDFFESVRSNQPLVIIPAVWGIESPRALPPNWKVVHPILPSQAKPVQGIVASFLDSTHCVNKGLILVSFGTQASLTQDQVEKIYDAISALKDFCFVWRLAARNAQPDFPTPSNALIVEWLPQNDLLGHPKTRAFVSHVGYGSLYEAAYHGIPIVGIPIFGDQEDNIHRAVLGGWGIRLGKNHFTSLDLVAAIRIAADEPMRLRARGIADLTKAYSGVTEVLDWMDYVSVLGVAHLMPYRAIRSSYRQQYNLDVSLAFGGILLGVVLLVHGLAKRIVHRTRTVTEKEKSA